jgi:DNA-binding IscR family transcriptional regulator
MDDFLKRIVYIKRKGKRTSDLILDILRTSKTPMSLDSLALVSGCRKDFLCTILSRLEKQGYVKKVYRKVTSYYIAIN